MKKIFLKVLIISLVIIILTIVIIFAYKIYQLNQLEKMNSKDMINYVTKNDDNTKISISIIKDGKLIMKFIVKMEKKKNT